MKFKNGNLNAYMEMMTRAEMQRALQGGQTNYKQALEVIPDKRNLPVEVVEYPRWLVKDAVWGIRPEIQKKMIESPDFLRSHLSEIMFDVDKKPIPKNQGELRCVATPTKAYWCHANDHIHCGLVAYMMIMGDIPMDEDASDYGWSKEIFYDDFICLAYEDYSNFKGWTFAESYSVYDQMRETLLELENMHSKYKNIFKKIGTSEAELEDSVNH